MQNIVRIIETCCGCNQSSAGPLDFELGLRNQHGLPWIDCSSCRFHDGAGPFIHAPGPSFVSPSRRAQAVTVRSGWIGSYRRATSGRSSFSRWRDWPRAVDRSPWSACLVLALFEAHHAMSCNRTVYLALTLRGPELICNYGHGQRLVATRRGGGENLVHYAGRKLAAWPVIQECPRPRVRCSPDGVFIRKAPGRLARVQGR
jgi:hypothetical protein